MHVPLLSLHVCSIQPFKYWKPQILRMFMLTCPHVAFLKDVCDIHKRTPAVSQLLFVIGERQRCYTYEKETPTTRTIQTIRAMNEACPMHSSLKQLVLGSYPYDITWWSPLGRPLFELHMGEYCTRKEYCCELHLWQFVHIPDTNTTYKSS